MNMWSGMLWSLLKFTYLELSASPISLNETSHNIKNPANFSDKNIYGPVGIGEKRSGVSLCSKGFAVSE